MDLLTLSSLVTVLLIIPCKTTTRHLIRGESPQDGDDFFTLIPDEGLRNITRVLAKVCPDTDFCGYSISDSSQRYGCCFSQCRCDVSCKVSQSCCPHVLHKFPTPNKAEKCKSAAILNRKELDLSDDYYFVEFCPSNADVIVKEACEKNVHNESFTFGDVTPVSDRVTNRNYFNRHCAVCNNVPTENLVLWLPNVLCQSGPFRGSEWSSLEDRVLHQEDCLITFDPPKEVDTNLTLCFSKIVSECNVTGRWALYDQELESACQLFPLSFTVRNPKKSTYGNVFCAMCNGEAVQRDLWMAPCNDHKINTMISLLVSVSLPAEGDDEGQSTCTGGDYLDPMTRGCQDLHCTKPMILAPHEHLCKDVINYVNFARHAIPLKVSLSTDNTITLRFADSIQQLLWVKFTNAYSGICALHFYFKLQHTYHQPSTSGPSTSYIEVPIKEVFVTVYLDVLLEAEPGVNLQGFITRLTNVTANLFNTRFTISYGLFDAPIQSPQTTTIQFFHSWMPPLQFTWTSNDISSPLTVYNDPYDNMSIVKGLYYPFDSTCDQSAILYDIGYLNCTAFIYNVQEHGIERVYNGLLFHGKDLFEFGQFQSVNESHVLICIDIVQARYSVSKGCRNCRLVIISFTFFVIVSFT